MNTVRKLYPTLQMELPLEGLYLGHDLRSIERGDRPFVYGNFITSLDGRIAIPGGSGDLAVPGAIKNDRDWRLFQELAVQADLLFTSGRYLREYENGETQEILQVHQDPRFEDLRSWRVDRGLAPFPDLAVISKSADFPIPEALRRDDRRVYVITTRSADPEKLRELEGEAEILFAGEESVDGGEMVRELHARGYRLMYSASGPQVMRLLIASNALDRLYLTQAGRILGGAKYATIVEGGLLEPPGDFTLFALYHDPAALDGVGQLFCVYDRE
ncbi:MAG TPA: dihydrofolate reductase family protein [Anaerolineales bacterium]|nr:dihydrofolate reductase family protein [Anaerolineales bacterium]